MSIIHTFKTKVMPIFFFALAIYTLITLFKTAADISRKKLNLSTDPPSARCIPFFDHVLDWQKENNDSLVLWDYIGGEAIARVCTNTPRASVVADITKFDGAEEYTPFAEQGCPLSQYWAQISDASNTGCVQEGLETQKYTCNQILTYDPCDAVCKNNNSNPPATCTSGGCQGWGFAFDVQALDGNFTTPSGESRPYPKCTIRFEFLEGLPKCEASWVGIFHTKSADLIVFTWLVVAVPIIVNIAQCVMLYKFDPAPPMDDDYYVSFAMRGISGPIYQFWWAWFSGRTHEFPKAKLTLATWIACLCQDLIEGLAAPIVSIHGCHISRFVVPFTLILVKAIKILVDVFMYFKDDDGDNEPAKGASSDDPNLMAVGMGSGSVNGSPMNQPMMMGQQPMMMNGQQQQPMMMMNGQAPQQQQMMPIPQQQQQSSNPQGGTQYASSTEV